MFADELAKMEVKFKELLKINENTKLQIAAEEDHYKVGKGWRHFRVEFRCQWTDAPWPPPSLAYYLPTSPCSVWLLSLRDGAFDTVSLLL